MNAADLSPEALALLLDEANHAPWESVQSALAGLEGAQHHRIGWLVSHLSQTKREYWRLIAGATGTPAAPDGAGLARLMAWEVDAARQLRPGYLKMPVQYGELCFDVASLLRLNIRHTTWHAGQLAALGRVGRA